MDVERTVTNLSQQAPCLLLMAAVVAGFLFYLDRKDTHEAENSAREDIVAIQRIEGCHAVQVQSMEVMRELTTVMREQGAAFRGITIKLGDIEDKLDVLLREQ